METERGKRGSRGRETSIVTGRSIDNQIDQVRIREDDFTVMNGNLLFLLSRQMWKIHFHFFDHLNDKIEAFSSRTVIVVVLLLSKRSQGDHRTALDQSDVRQPSELAEHLRKTV